MNCQSCGMPMDKPEDHGGGDVNNLYCRYCTDETGKLMPREQVRAKMVQFYVQKQGKEQAEAEKLTDQLMANMPAWKGGESAPVEPTAPTNEPPAESTIEPTIEPTAPEKPVTESPPPLSTPEPPPTEPETPPAESETPPAGPVEETPGGTPTE
jgi:hypothetical protein